MSVLGYVAKPASGFSPAEQAVIAQWRNALDADDAWKLIGRNFDRDCARGDIAHRVLRDFLREVAKRYVPGGTVDPLETIDNILAASRPAYALPGGKLSGSVASVARVLRADHLLKYQLAGTAVTRDLTVLIQSIQSGAITGQDLQGSDIGRKNYPVWVCPSTKLGSTADQCRDALGLHHIHHGHLVALTYPVSLLSDDHTALRAPTVLDAVASGADNWIFAKRKASGGPQWGHAVDLAACAAGTDEAVHASFSVDANNASSITLSYVGQITASSPQVSFANLLLKL